jgi:hypothetical protein
VVVGGKDYQLSHSAKLKKLDEHQARAKESRAALIKSIKEESERAEKAEISKQL